MHNKHLLINQQYHMREQNQNTLNTSLRSHFENKGVSRTVFIRLNEIGPFSRALLWLFSETRHKRLIFLMSSSINTMIAKNGTIFTTLYLKECVRLLMKVVAGEPEECTTFPRVGTRRGLPLIIPGPLRVSIERRDIVVIQLVISLLSVYRVVKIKPTLKINTITDVFKGFSKTLDILEIKESLRRLGTRGKFITFPEATLMPTTTAGPNYKISVLGCTLDA